MKIIIAGAGNVGTHLAKLLSREKQDIILMDDDEEKLTALSSNFDLLIAQTGLFSQSRMRCQTIRILIYLTSHQMNRFRLNSVKYRRNIHKIHKSFQGSFGTGHEGIHIRNKTHRLL